MRDSRMAVSLPADEAKECRPGKRAGARNNTASRYGLSSLSILSHATNVSYILRPSRQHIVLKRILYTFDILKSRMNKIIDE